MVKIRAPKCEISSNEDSEFQLKSGVNYNPGDPNYDLFQKSCVVSAKRLFPNYVNEDAPYNAKFYKKDDPDTHVATMG